MRMLMIAAMLLPLAACQSNWEKKGQTAEAAGTGATRSFAASGFTGVDLRGPDDIDVKTGASFSVTAEGEAKVLDQLDIRVVDGSLRVGRKDRKGDWLHGDRGAKIHVVMPRLTTASVGGSGNLTIDKAEGDFGGAVAGSGNLTVGALAGGATELSVAGSGDLSIGGNAKALRVSIVGSGDVDAKKLTAERADVSVAGSGTLRGVVKGQASVSIVGSGDVELTGGAQCSVNRVGSGEAHCS